MCRSTTRCAAFAAERIKKCTITEASFTPIKTATGDDFEPSLGLGSGKPERVVLEFSARVAPYVRERVWHKSQQIEELPGGGVRLGLKVSRDWALHGWVLSWGPHVHVTSPSSLAQEILDMLDDAREFYVPRLDFTQSFSAVVSSASPSLPFLESKPASKRRSAAPS